MVAKIMMPKQENSVTTSKHDKVQPSGQGRFLVNQEKATQDAKPTK